MNIGRLHNGSLEVHHLVLPDHVVNQPGDREGGEQDRYHELPCLRISVGGVRYTGDSGHPEDDEQKNKQRHDERAEDAEGLVQIFEHADVAKNAYFEAVDSSKILKTAITSHTFRSATSNGSVAWPVNQAAGCCQEPNHPYVTSSIHRRKAECR